MIPNRIIPSTLNSLITVAILLPFVALVLVSVHGSGQQQMERSIQILPQRNQPVEITGIKVKGTAREFRKKFASNKDWLDGLVITVKNVSDNPIVYVSLLLLVPNERNGMRVKVGGLDNYSSIELSYGTPPPSTKDGEVRNDVASLMPGMTVDLRLDEKQLGELHRRILMSNYSIDVSELTLTVYRVAFYGDDRLWLNGLWSRRDPKTGGWLVINDPPRLNHTRGSSPAQRQGTLAAIIRSAPLNGISIRFQGVHIEGPARFSRLHSPRERIRDDARLQVAERIAANKRSEERYLDYHDRKVLLWLGCCLFKSE